VRDRIAPTWRAAWRGSAGAGRPSACACCCPTFDREPVHELDGLSLDRLDIECTHYTPAPSC
jgi:7-cyano-7-deazaguanine reductase